jgi:hypothetical protein
MDVRCHDEVDGVEQSNQCRFVQNGFRVPPHLQEVLGVMAEGIARDQTRRTRSVRAGAGTRPAA